jgi:hypothetical protein
VTLQYHSGIRKRLGRNVKELAVFSVLPDDDHARRTFEFSRAAKRQGLE